MKKNFKLVLALVLSIMMVLGSMSALAAVATSTPVRVGLASTDTTITAPSTAHQYEIYQIFAGDLATVGGNKVLSNVVWGVNSQPEAGKTAGQAVSQTVLDALAALTGTDATKLATINTYVDLTTAPVAVITNGASVTVPTGYYLIKDVDDSITGDDAYTQYIVQVVGPTDIVRKADKPSSEKKVEDKNDSTSAEYETVTVNGVTSTWQDSADYDVNDDVPFKLTATIPATLRLNDFTHYTLKFTDTISKGLTYKAGTVSIKVNDTEVATTEPTITDAADANGAFKDGKVLTWDLGDVKIAPYNVKTEGTEYVVTIEYMATLNSSAVIGDAGNPNKMHIEYSNNPNDENDKGTTPDDYNKVFTFEVNVDKYEMDGQTKKPLKGADFTLYKKVADTATTGAKTGSAIKTALAAIDPSIKADGLDNNTSYVEVGKVTVTGDTTTFEFERLDAGDYVLVETKIPAGYNAAESEVFTITATHSAEDNDPQLLTFTVDNTDLTATKTTGLVKAEIENNKGATLPSTGGIGTTIFYIGGSILVLAAAILLITKRRMGNND